MVLEHLLTVTAAALLIVMLLAGLFLAVIQILYFSPNRPRRRMPSWLIVAVLIAFLIMPKIDTVYALNHSGDKAEQAS